MRYCFYFLLFILIQAQTIALVSVPESLKVPLPVSSEELQEKSFFYGIKNTATFTGSFQGMYFGLFHVVTQTNRNTQLKSHPDPELLIGFLGFSEAVLFDLSVLGCKPGRKGYVPYAQELLTDVLSENAAMLGIRDPLGCKLVIVDLSENTSLGNEIANVANFSMHNKKILFLFWNQDMAGILPESLIDLDLFQMDIEPSEIPANEVTADVPVPVLPDPPEENSETNPNAYQEKKAKKGHGRIWPESGLLSLGLDFGGQYFNLKDVDNMIKTWSDSSRVVISNMYKDVKLGFSGSGYLGLTPIKFLQIRFECSYYYTPKWFKYDYGDNALQLSVTSVTPGVSANLVYRKLRFGVGYYRSYGTFFWNDYVVNKSFTWTDESWGYRVYLGLNSQTRTGFGFSANAVYNSLVLKHLRNENSRVVKVPDENRNFVLDLSGFEIRIGVNYSFLKIGGHHE